MWMAACRTAAASMSSFPRGAGGPILSIRKFKRTPLADQDLVRNGSVTPLMLEYLAASIAGKKNILICGGTGTGKTTLLNVLSSYIGARNASSPSRTPPNCNCRRGRTSCGWKHAPHLPMGANAVTARDLMRNARCGCGMTASSGRSPLQRSRRDASGRGHRSRQLHSQPSRPARCVLERLEMLMGLNGFSADLNTVRRFIANAVDIVVHLVRRPDASRAIATICEVTGSENGIYLLRDKFHSEAGSGRRKGVVDNAPAARIAGRSADCWHLPWPVRTRAAEPTRVGRNIGRPRRRHGAPSGRHRTFPAPGLMRSLHIWDIALRPRDMVPVLAFSALAALIVAVLFGPLCALCIIAAVLLTGLGC